MTHIFNCQCSLCRAKFPLFISQDGTPAHQGVANLCKSHAHEGIRYLHHIELAPPVTLSKKEKQAYYRIANHYKFLMQTFFDCFQYPRLIFLEAGAACWSLMRLWGWEA